jgi:membrane protein
VDSGRGFKAWQMLALLGLAVVARGYPERVADRPTEDFTGTSSDEVRPQPAASWTAILKRTFAEFLDDRILALAAGVTYYVLLALFPALTALVSLYGLFADPATISQHLDSVSGLVPAGAIQIISDQLHRLTSHKPSVLGLGFVIGLAVALWSTSAGMKSLFDALNVVYDESETHGYVRLTVTALAFTIGTIIFLLVGSAAVVVLPAVLNFVGLGSTTELLMKLLRWPLLLGVAILALAALYFFGPSRTQSEWRWVTWGSAAASLAWVAASLLFSWYVQNFGNYDKTYGSLGAVIAFMTWLWLSTAIFLLGAELDSEIERSAKAQTTRNSNDT